MHRSLFRAVLAVLVLCGTTYAPTGVAQGTTPQTLQVIVPYPAGGGSDVIARALAPKMAEVLGHAVVVENRPGASGIVAAEYVAKVARADGFTTLMGDMGTFAVNAGLYKKLPYNALEDFAPASLSIRAELVVVVNPATLSVNSMKELVDAARKAPNGIFYASPGPGVPHHLATELFANRAEAKLVPVHFKGGAPAVESLLRGDTPVMFGDVTSVLPHIRAGKLRPLAVPTDRRVDVLPEVPTLAELGWSGLSVYAWQGFVMRKGTPQANLQRVGDAVRRALEDPGVRKLLLARGGIQITPGDGAEMAELMRTETARWREIIQKVGISAE